MGLEASKYSAHPFAPLASERCEVGIVLIEAPPHFERKAVAFVAGKIDGMPTERLLRIVESKESNTDFTALDWLVSWLMTQSRIGLPYFVSPSG